jgi:signal peptidase I
MADEPLNPYTPSRAAEMAPETAPQGRASGILAVVASLLCAQPFAGLGLYVLGRKRRFLAWAVPATLAEVLMIVGAWTGLSTLFLVALGAILLLVLGSFVDTLMARSSSAAPSFRRALVTVLLVFVGGRAALYGVKQWLVEGFSIPSAAMVRSLLVGDHVMVKKKVDDVRRGDMVVFRYPPDPSITFIKRIVALGGDTVEIRSNAVVVNGVALPQSPRSEACPPSNDTQGDCRVLEERGDAHLYTIMLDGPFSSDFHLVEVPPGHVFVMGDNRNNSKDSRVWGFLPVGNLIGVPTLVYFSLSPGGDMRWDRVGRRL